MTRRYPFVALLFAWFVSSARRCRGLRLGQIRLARHPDYHAGKIAFSYLGDIWTANEDGTGVAAPHRQPRARGLSALLARRASGSRSRRTATATTTSSSSPATGGAPQRLTFHTGNDEVVGWTRDSQSVIFRAARGDGAFPNVATLYQIAGRPAGRRQPLPVDWGYWGSFSPDGKSLVFNRHPAVWSRQHYRGSYAADLWIADLADKTYTKLLGDERYNRYWPMWGADDAIYFVADPLPNDKSVEAGQPRGSQERQQHLQDSGERRPAGAGDASTPTATCSGRRCRATAR